MSTNYYLRKGCPSCRREDSIHVGKSAGGWMFSARMYQGVVDYPSFADDLKERVGNGYVLYDEYGKEQEVGAFLNRIEAIPATAQCHACSFPDNDRWATLQQTCDHIHRISFHPHEFS
jgi:hypothetical protein